jgi:hypothetical protein
MEVLHWNSELPHWQEIVTLDNKLYILTALWNGRSDSWVVSLSTFEGEEIISGRRLDVGVNILNNVYNTNKPNGYIVVTPNDSDITTVTRDNMGRDVNLVFIKSDEIL